MDKNDLEKLLEFVLEIVELPGNEWAKHRLINRLNPKGLVVDDITDKHIKSKVALIERYLNIDVNILIDYKDFDKPVQEQLFRDCLEMNRFHKGTANHRVNFEEFCRYAHLQAEEMINYYFEKISGGKVQIAEGLIKKYVLKYNAKRPPNHIYEIGYSYKLTAIKSMLKIEKVTTDQLFFLNKLRNEASHRSSLTLNNEDKELEKYEITFRNKKIDFEDMSNEERKIYDTRNFILNKRKQDFRAVYSAIEDLKGIILKYQKSRN